MKRAFSLVLTLFCILAVVPSCQKAPELTITSSPNLELSVDGSSGTITFTANRDWRVSSSDSWVTVSPSSGTASDGPVTVNVRCNANTTYDDRTATVTITMEELSQKVTVRQPANLGIVLPTQAYDLQSDARSIEVTVQANVDYTVETSVDWIKQTGTKGLTSRTLNFSIEENKTYDAREGKITIKPKQAGVTEQVISVRQAQKDALIVEKTSYDMPYGGGEMEIKVEANVAYDVTPNVDWLHYVSTKALSSSTVVIKVDENATYSSREGKIEIAQQNGSLKHIVTVKQAGRIAVTSVELDQTSLALKPEDTVTLVATVKPDNATDKTVTWTSSDANVASVNEDGVVIAIADGEADITATAGEKKATCKVTVKDPLNEAIVFADAKIKEKLIAAFDTNHDGELSYKEASVVTSLNGVFGTEKNYTSFDEFQYFTGITDIENKQFAGWDLESIILPKNINRIGSDSMNADVFRDCIFLKSITIPEGVEIIGGGAFRGCTSLESITIPNSVVSICKLAFRGCTALSTIKLPEGITRIENLTFEECTGLTSVSIPNGVTSIGGSAFQCCRKLPSITLPETVTSIEDGAFYMCNSLTSINIPNSVTNIGVNAFYECKSLISITIPAGITRIEEGTFYNCEQLVSVGVPESIKFIGFRALQGCKSLTSFVIPEGVQKIDGSTFYNCRKLESVSIPQTVTSIGPSAFYQCTSLASISFPNSLTQIMDYAFYSCWSLSNITLPEGIASIGESAFQSCTKLSSISILASSVPTGGYHMFDGTNECPIYVPANSVDKYKNATVWSSYSSRILAIQPEAIDLGLSVKWASWNIGASAPEEYGDYYGWGETITKSDYSWDTYSTHSSYGTDYNSVIQEEDDVAHILLGGKWRIPTDAEWTELRDNCTWTWTSQNGVNGGLFTSKKNGASIFLPAAGSKVSTVLNGAGSFAHYWSSSLQWEVQNSAWSVGFYSEGVERSYGYRYYGFSIRPVTD